MPRSRKYSVRPFRYRMDRWVRNLVMRVIGWLAPELEAVDLNPRSSSVKQILLVRANFRMGNAVLALPAIAAFRKNFPDARIDFVGSPISALLFQHQPLNCHYNTPRHFPQAVWQYPRLIRSLRANRYDLAVDLSCSHSGLAAFIIGLCRARIRAGITGKWDRAFNLKTAKPRSRNKYGKLTEFLTALGLQDIESPGSIQFSPAEKAEGNKRLQLLVGQNSGKVVGVFVGGRKLRGKRWPLENFTGLINKIHQQGLNVIVFLGPEETELAEPLRAAIDPSVPVIFEPSARKFAALITGLDLMICCDSGPMHLACATGVPVVAIFLQGRNVERWSPPPSAARTIRDPNRVRVVLEAALEELSVEPSLARTAISAAFIDRD